MTKPHWHTRDVHAERKTAERDAVRETDAAAANAPATIKLEGKRILYAVTVTA
jgi:hypothetical protein